MVGLPPMTHGPRAIEPHKALSFFFGHFSRKGKRFTELRQSFYLFIDRWAQSSNENGKFSVLFV